MELDYNDDPLITEELFTRITLLEIENNELEEKLSSIITKINNLELREDKERKEILSSEITLIKSNSLEFPFKDDDFTEVTISSDALNNINLIEHKIAFVPFDLSFDKIFIKGDFTNWQLKEMKRQNNLFTYDTFLLKSMKYFYCFETNGSNLCDFNSDMMENPMRNNELNNILNSSTCSENNYFNNNQENNWKEQEELILKYNEIKAKINNKSLIPHDENSTIEKLSYFSLNYSKVNNVVLKEKEKYLNKINSQYDLEFKEILSEIAEKKELLREFFEGRVINIDNNFIYLISEIDVKNKCFSCYSLYDRNGIKIDLSSKYKILQSVTITQVLQKGKIFNFDQSKEIIKNHNESNNKLKILYKVLCDYGIAHNNYEENENEEGEDGQSNKEIVPYKILPEGTDLNDYNLIIDQNLAINAVKTRDTGEPVCFEAIEVTNHNAKDNRKFSGLVGTSIMKVYTAVISKDIINIIHIHLNDTSSEIAVDSVFIEKNDDITSFKVFKKDITGKTLDYKIIFRDYKLEKIYYNLSNNYIDEPNFEEVRMSVGNFIKIATKENDKFHLFNGYSGKIVSIKPGMLVRRNNTDDQENNNLEKRNSVEIVKGTSCSERHLEELQGYITVHILFNKSNELLENKEVFSLPICQTLLLSLKAQVELEKIIIKNQLNEELVLQNTLETLYEEAIILSKYSEKSNQKELDSIEKIKNVINTLEVNFEIFKTLSSTEDQEKISVIKRIGEDIVPKMYLLLRAINFG